MNLSDLASIATMGGVVLAAALLGYTAYQVSLSARVSRAQFWLELEKMFSQHDEVHLKLRPGGAWADGRAGPTTVADWGMIEDYMGLFEHCEIMMRKGLLDAETFRSIFSYRLINVLANRTIVKAKLIDHRSGWTTFVALCDRMHVRVPEG